MIVPILTAVPAGTEAESPAGDPAVAPAFGAVLEGVLRTAGTGRGGEASGGVPEPDTPPREEASREPAGWREGSADPGDGAPLPAPQVPPAEIARVPVPPLPEALSSGEVRSSGEEAGPAAHGSPAGGREASRIPGPAAGGVAPAGPVGSDAPLEDAPAGEGRGAERPRPEAPSGPAPRAKSPAAGSPAPSPAAPKDTTAAPAHPGERAAGVLPSGRPEKAASATPPHKDRPVPPVPSGRAERTAEAGRPPEGCGSREEAPPGRVSEPRPPAVKAGTRPRPQGETVPAAAPGVANVAEKAEGRAPRLRMPSGRRGKVRAAGPEAASAPPRSPAPAPADPEGEPEGEKEARRVSVPESAARPEPAQEPSRRRDGLRLSPASARTAGADRPGGAPVLAEPARKPDESGPRPGSGEPAGRPAPAAADAPAPSRPQETPPPGPAQARAHPAVLHTLERVQWAWSRGMDRVTVRLFPPELGRVEVTLHRRRNGLAARFRVETPEALRVLGDGMAALRQGLEARGVEVLHVVVDLRDASQDGRKHHTGRRAQHTRVHAARRTADLGVTAPGAPPGSPAETRVLDVVI